MPTVLKPQPLTQQGFAEFGDVVELAGARHFGINQGFAERYNDLARVDVGAGDGGHVNISIVVAKPRPTPIAISIMERHPLGTQIFYPLQDRPWLVLVCRDPGDPASYRAFRATGLQGVNYARNTWHHPLLVHDPDSRFLVVDRKGTGSNLEEMTVSGSPGLVLTP
jgi:ureidoglycolate lyase